MKPRFIDLETIDTVLSKKDIPGHDKDRNSATITEFYRFINKIPPEAWITRIPYKFLANDFVPDYLLKLFVAEQINTNKWKAFACFVRIFFCGLVITAFFVLLYCLSFLIKWFLR
jgi:hypothetical protein